MKRRMVLAAGFAALIGALPAAHAAEFPTKPITLVLGFAPGGPSDVMARILTKKMEELLKQPVVIENRAGAGGGIAANAVARAAPDGYTILLATGSSLAINVSLYKNLGYDPKRISSRSASSAPRPICSTPIRDRCRRRRWPSSSPT